MEELDFYTKKFEDGKISRREFMGRAVALGVAVGVASTMADEALAQSPKKGGHLRMGIGAGASDDTLDPATYGENFTQNMGFATRNYLTEIDREGNLVGELATEWGASDDAVQWTFKLRNDVEFHNGKTMDAEDVIASYNHHRNEDSVSAMKDIAKTITDMKAVDKNTVQFTLEAGNADFPYIVSDYHIAILPSKDGVAVWQDGGGTGGYMVENFEPGVRLDLKRHPNFFKGDERAHFDSGEILVMLDQVARTNALTTGELDVMDRCELKTLHLLERDDNLRIEETTGTQHFTLPMRADTAPFNDINVRMAIKLSLDREALLRTLLRGHGALGNDHPISTANQYHNGNLPQREYDPDMAKWYLRQSGLGRLAVDIYLADTAFAGAVDTGVLYKEHAKASGIDITVHQEPKDGYWSAIWMQKGWCASYWGGRPTEDWMFSVAYAAGANWNESFFEHTYFNELLVAARAELDSDKRREMYGRMQGIVRDEGSQIVPVFSNYVFAMNKSVQHGPSMAANWDMDGLRGFERWWFA